MWKWQNRAEQLTASTLYQKKHYSHTFHNHKIITWSRKQCLINFRWCNTAVCNCKLWITCKIVNGIFETISIWSFKHAYFEIYPIFKKNTWYQNIHCEDEVKVLNHFGRGWLFNQFTERVFYCSVRTKHNMLRKKYPMYTKLHFVTFYVGYSICHRLWKNQFEHCI